MFLERKPKFHTRFMPSRNYKNGVIHSVFEESLPATRHCPALQEIAKLLQRGAVRLPAESLCFECRRGIPAFSWWEAAVTTRDSAELVLTAPQIERLAFFRIG